MHDQDPSSNPNPKGPDFTVQHRGSTVEFYSTEQLAQPGMLQGTNRIFDRSDFGGNTERVTVDHAIVELDTGEAGMALTLTIQLDQLKSQDEWLTNVRTNLDTSRSYTTMFYTAERAVFDNVLSLNTKEGLRLLTWFDPKSKNIVVTNCLTLHATSKDSSAKAEIKPAPLDSFDATAQLQAFSKVLIEVTDKAARSPRSYNDVELRRVYKLGEQTRPTPNAANQKVGRTAIKQPSKPGTEALAGDNTVPEIVDLAPDESVKIDDIGGNEALKTELKNIALSFTHSEIMEKWGASRPQGVLLYGEPGTGKTMLATALAHEIGADLWKIQSSDIYVKWLGDSEQKIKELFATMKVLDKPTVVLFDEFDAIVGITEDPRPGGADNARNSVAGIFKQEMNDLAKQNPNILIVATTNHPERIDQSLVRSGRFDHRIYVPMPDTEARQQIMSSIIARQMLTQESADFTMFANDISLPRLSELSDGFSGADIAEVFRRIGLSKAMHEARNGSSSPITQAELEATILTLRREKA